MSDIIVPQKHVHELYNMSPDWNMKYIFNPTRPATGNHHIQVARLAIGRAIPSGKAGSILMTGKLPIRHAQNEKSPSILWTKCKSPGIYLAQP